MFTILYVEDNDLLREMMGELMEGPNRRVTLCADAEAALAACAEQAFDLVVTDVSLPGLSGTELARRLLAQRPQQWLALCSGYDLSAQLDALGPNVRALAKPFDVDEFDALVSAAGG